jgi:acetyl-CoA C-acetyltransferase
VLRTVYITGAAMTKFGKREDKGLIDLAVEAGLGAINDSGQKDLKIDAVFVGNAASGQFCGMENLGPIVAEHLGLLPCEAERIENTTASGSCAVKEAYRAVAGGFLDCALVVGVEKMTHMPTDDATRIIASAMTHPTGETVHGVTMPSLAAMFTKRYMEKFDLSTKHLAMVAVKNHNNALLNRYAHFHKKLTLEEAMASRVVADPIRVTDCAPMSDGAAAVLLQSEEDGSRRKESVRIAGVGHSTDRQMFYQRAQEFEISAVREAGLKAFHDSGLAPSAIDVAELHDAFTVLEIVESEDLGFFPKGQGARALEDGLTQINGEMPINTSGGLKARGHPLGATGVAQIVDLVWQLRGQAGPRQVPGARNALAVNFAGLGNSVVVTVLQGVEG